MPVVGIVAEFDPLHLGHAHLIGALRERLGRETPVVAAMSGSFTQRGEAAICTAAARAEMALEAGADLVLELPAACSVASAEAFARYGVEALQKTGVVDTLGFGSESGDVFSLRRWAAGLNSPAFGPILREESAKGISFAHARTQALERLTGGKPPAGANDLLAMEYLRFWPGEAVAVQRRDGGHGGGQSASEVRRRLSAGDWSGAMKLLPRESAAILEREAASGRCPASLVHAERAVLYRLRTMTASDFAALPDCTEGLEHRLVAAAGEADTLEDFYARAKSKRYAHARIRRIALRAFLGITALPEQVDYLRVLGASEVGLALLHEMRTRAAVPIITKPAHGKALPEPARARFALDRRCDDLWGLCLERPIPAGWSWRQTPVMRQKK